MKIVIEKILSAEQEAEVDERFAEADKYGSRFPISEKGEWIWPRKTWLFIKRQ